MKPISRTRVFVFAALLLSIAAVVVFRSMRPAAAMAVLTPIINATKTAAPDTTAGGDVNGNGVVNPGDRLTYTVTINNTGPDPATGVSLNDTIDANSTLVPGSVIASAVAVNDSFSSIGNVGLNVPAANGLLANDLDPNNPGVNTALVIVAPPTASANGGNLLINATTGAFTYNPAPGFEGIDTFTYTLSNGSTLTDTATVSITVSGMIWFVQNGAPACTSIATGCGRLSNPFSSLEAFRLLNNGTGNNPAANDNIFLYESATAYTTTVVAGITLLSGQKLIGQDATASLATISGVAVPANSNALPAMNPAAGSATTIQNPTALGNAITLNAGGNTIRGLTVSGTPGAGMIGTSVATLVVGSDVITTGIGGNDLDLSGAANGNIDFGASVTNTAGRSVSIQNRSGGTVNITGPISDTGTGILLNSNAGATLSFTGGLNISTAANAAFTATGGGTVNVCDEAAPCNPAATGSLVNTLTTTTGTALNVANTNIGANNLEFKSISAGTAASGPASGIILNTTGTTAGTNGGLVVKGDAGGSSNGSGGTIQHTTSHGVNLNSTRDVSLGYMNINNSGDCGIQGFSVTNFTLNRSNVDNNGNSTSDEGIQLGLFAGATVGATGNVTITNSDVNGNAHNNFHLRNTSGTITAFTVTNTTFNNLNDTFGADSFLYEMSGTAVTTAASLTGCAFVNNSPQRALEVQVHDSGRIGAVDGTTTFTVSGGTFTDNGIHASFTQDASVVGNNSSLAFKFINNGTAAAPMTGSQLQAINIFSSSQALAGTIIGTISNNFIGNAAVPNSGATSGGAITGVIQGQTDANLLISGNTIRQTSGDARAIGIAFRGPAPPAATSIPANTVVSDLTITNNNVVPGAAPSGFPLSAIMIEADNQTGSDAKSPTVRATITGNTVPATSAFDLLPTQLAYYEYDALNAHGIGQLVDTGAASASATAELTSTNTGSASAFGVSLIAGPLIPPAIAPLANDVSARLDNGLGEQLALLDFDIQASILQNLHTNLKDHGSALSSPSADESTSTSSTDESPLLVVGLIKRFAEMIQPTAHASGENVAKSLGTLPPGENIRVQFKVTVDANIPTSKFSVSNQGTISGTDFANVLTDDPAVAGAANPTMTTVVQPATLTKAFGNSNIALNGTTSLTFTIGNANPATAFTNVAFSDSLPAGMVIATPNGLVNNCGGGTVTATQNTNLFSISGLSRPANSSCTVVINVQGTTDSIKNNTTGTISSTQGGTGLTASASATVITAPSFTKSFGAATIPLNGSTSLSFTVTNNSATTSLSGAAFTDTLPAGLVVATPNGLSGSCGAGTITATAAAGSISLAGGSIPASSNCTFSVNVTGTTAGVKNNSVGLSTAQLGAGATATASVTVIAPPTIAKSFSPTSIIQSNGFSTLTLAITNPQTTALTGVGVVDNFPAGMEVDATPTATNSCATGTFAPVAAATSVTVNGATIPASTTCNFTVRVRGTTSGAKVNTTDNVTSTNGGNGLTANATLTVANTVTWNGATSANWATNTNWTPNVVPVSTNDVDIPATGVTTNPTISAAGVTVNSITEAAARTLTINSGLNLAVTNICTINGTLTVAGSFTCGTLAGTGTVAFTGAAGQNIPGLTFQNLTINDGGANLAGNATVNGVLTLTNGNLDTGANTLTIGTGGSAVHASGHVIGTLLKLFGGNGSFTYPVGTTNGYSPVDVTVTAGTGQLSVKANVGTAPATPPLDSNRMLQRFWTLNGSGITSNVTFHYLGAATPAGDVPATSTESQYSVFRISGGSAMQFNPDGTNVILNAAGDSFTVNGLTNFSDWTAGEPLPLTAAPVGVTGRVVTQTGRGVFGARVVLVDEDGNIRNAITNPFGYFRFDDVASGRTYVVNVTHKYYRFTGRAVSVFDEISDLNFIAEQ